MTSSEDDTSYQRNHLMTSQEGGWLEITSQSPVRKERKTRGSLKRDINQAEAVVTLPTRDTINARLNSQSSARKKGTVEGTNSVCATSEERYSRHSKVTMKRAVQLVRYHGYTLWAATQETRSPQIHSV